MITFFEACFIAHIIGDYLLQTDLEANQKAIRRFANWPLFRHVLKYTACFILPILLFNGSWIWLAWIFSTHYILDRRTFVVWWRMKVMRNSEESIKNTFWLTIIVDQIFHILAFGLMCALT